MWGFKTSLIAASRCQNKLLFIGFSNVSLLPEELSEPDLKNIPVKG